MKKLVLLGDSIRLIGYGAKLAELLSDEYETWQPEDNCRWADYTYRMLFDYRDNIADADVIHWNNGHWDICDLFGEGPFTPLNQYVEDMVRIAKKLLKITPNVIFATTTTVKKENKYNFLNKFEFGYALTGHLSQGSQYNKVIVYAESFGSWDFNKRWLYTCATRAIDELIIAVD